MASRADTEASINNDHGLLAKPLHLQRLEQALRLEPFLDYMQNVFSESQSDAENGDDGSPSEIDLDEEIFKEKFSYRQERRCDKLRLYNFSKVKKSRLWLKDIVLSDSSDTDDSSDSITEEDLQDMLRLHKLQKTAQAEFHNNVEADSSHFLKEINSNNDVPGVLLVSRKGFHYALYAISLQVVLSMIFLQLNTILVIRTTL